MPDEITTLEEALRAAHGASRIPVPTSMQLPDLAAAYAVQRRLAERSGLPVMLWKLGVTSAGARAAFDTHEPVIGRLPASAIYSDGGTIHPLGREMYAEAELVFELGEDLPRQAEPYTRDDLCRAIKGIYGGIEIVRTRFESSELSLPQLVADNVMAHGLVWGRKLADSWDDRFADMPVDLLRNADSPVEGSTAAVLTDPLDALVWLANWLREHEGTTLKREQLIASGTCTGATEISDGDTIRIRFGGVDAARVTLDARL